MSTHTRRRLAAVLLALPLAAACTDQPLVPTPASPAPAGMAHLECSVDVRAASLTCAPATASGGGASLDRVLGGQETYLRLAGSGASYDGGTQEFEIDVTVQNLTDELLGTPDGTTVEGVKVFFASGPTNGVVVANATGTDLFLSGSSPYFLYSEILEPYEITAPVTWIFDTSSGATSFTFSVYVSTPMPDESAPLLDAVWGGSASSAWELADNWADGSVPGATSTVAIPADSLFAGAQPVLAADAAVRNVRVGFASTLDLGGHTLTAGGNVDAPGTIQNGTLLLSGTGVVVGGTVPSVQVTGSARLQTAVRASGAVSISGGSVTISDNALSINIP